MTVFLEEINSNLPGPWFRNVRLVNPPLGLFDRRSSESTEARPRGRRTSS
jgi:hypothetical protein